MFWLHIYLNLYCNQLLINAPKVVAIGKATYAFIAKSILAAIKSNDTYESVKPIIENHNHF